MRHPPSVLSVVLLSAFLFATGCDSGPGPNTTPNVQISFTPNTPRAGQAITFEAEANDPDGEIESYDWSTSDGASGSGRTFTHAFEERGDFSVSVTVEDDRGGAVTGSQQLAVDRRFSEATISDIEVEEMPFTDSNGNQWDPASPPDVYFTAVRNGRSSPLATSEVSFNTEPSGLPVVYPQTEFTVEDLTVEHSINLYDFDANSVDAFIGGVGFSLDTDPGQYPEEVTIEFEDITYQVDVEWSN
jgi:hypothetical protein